MKGLTGDSNPHRVCGAAVEGVVKNSLKKKSADNVTAVIIGFENIMKKSEKKENGFISLLNNNMNMFI